MRAGGEVYLRLCYVANLPIVTREGIYRVVDALTKNREKIKG